MTVLRIFGGNTIVAMKTIILLAYTVLSLKLFQYQQQRQERIRILTWIQPVSLICSESGQEHNSVKAQIKTVKNYKVLITTPSVDNPMTYSLKNRDSSIYTAIYLINRLPTMLFQETAAHQFLHLINNKINGSF